MSKKRTSRKPRPAHTTAAAAAAVPERLVIDCHALWERLYRTPGGMRSMQLWLRANRIKPGDVPVHSEMVIEDSAFGLAIRYEAYRINEHGLRYVDPDTDRPATAHRTALLQLPPPADWLAPAGGAQK
ncbi:hypothetical protein [Streptomyces viridosporus]|uniref:hypothetical protein n=1 Tax=Streptomyces viridosporus TaxID=67581 RepID=UPI0036FD49A4